MQPSQNRRILIERYFAGLAEHTFQSRLGVVDPPIVDYITDLLVRFVRLDSVHRMRTITGEPILQIGEMISEAKKRLGDARRDIHQHIGDFTLFWAGLFPEAVKKRMGDSAFHVYCSHGKRSYFIASEIETTDKQAAPSEVLQRLSDQFELCVYGIREVRREWETRDGEEGNSLSILLN